MPAKYQNRSLDKVRTSHDLSNPLSDTLTSRAFDCTTTLYSILQEARVVS